MLQPLKATDILSGNVIFLGHLITIISYFSSLARHLLFQGSPSPSVRTTINQAKTLSLRFTSTPHPNLTSHQGGDAQLGTARQL